MENAFAWAGRLRTRHNPPRDAVLIDGKGPRGQRRVMILGDHANSLSHGDQRKWMTTYLYNEDGTLDADEQGVWRLDHSA